MSFARQLKLITFDFLGTLAEINGSVAEHYLMEARNLGMRNIQAIDIKSVFPRVFQSIATQYPNFGYGRISSGEWWEKVIINSFNQLECDKNGVDLKELSLRLFSKFSTKQGYKCYPETKQVLSHLKTKGFSLGVISNSDERLHKVIEELELSKYLDFVLTSKEVGYEKPNKEIFLTALKRVGVLGEKSLHVGDDVEKDIKGAASAGMHSILIDRKETKVKNCEIQNELGFLMQL